MTKKKGISISESRLISLDLLDPNSGQIEGVPANPRYLKDRGFKRLKRSIKENPELLSYRELLVYPYADGRYIIIGVNSRYRALLELKYKEAPCKVLDKRTDIEQLKRYILIDNHSSGEWETMLLAEGWTQLEIDDIGLDIELPDLTTDDIFGDDNPDTEEDSTEGDEDDVEDDKQSFYQSMLSDCLYESNNIYDIPTLRLEMQNGMIILHIAA